MHRTIEAVIHPDGTVEVLEPVSGVIARRALLTILDEPPAVLPGAPAGEARSEVSRADAALRAAGLLMVPDDIPSTLEPLTEAARAALARRLSQGTPLSQLIIDDREESW